MPRSKALFFIINASYETNGVMSERFFFFICMYLFLTSAYLLRNAGVHAHHEHGFRRRRHVVYHVVHGRRAQGALPLPQIVRVLVKAFPRAGLLRAHRLLPHRS